MHACTHAGFEDNFEIVDPATTTTQGIAYDLMSIMHYGAYAFTSNSEPTIEPVDGSISLSALGQRDVLTNLDIQHVNRLYCADCKCTLAQ